MKRRRSGCLAYQGNDVYTTDGKVNNGIKIKIIGGYDKDSIIINSLAGHHTKTYVYDGPDDYIQASARIKRHISSDSAIHAYQYRDYIYDMRGTKSAFFYNLDDRLFVGFGYDGYIMAGENYLLFLNRI